MNETKQTPKNKLEIFSFLNALLVQFSKLNGFEFEISHSCNSATDTICMQLKFAEPDCKSEQIIINLLTEGDIQRQFEMARVNIVSFTKNKLP